MLMSVHFRLSYFFSQDKTEMLNLSTKESSYLLAIIGIANTIGRVVLGYISSKPWVNRLWIYISCLLICGFGENTLSIDPNEGMPQE